MMAGQRTATILCIAILQVFIAMILFLTTPKTRASSAGSTTHFLALSDSGAERSEPIAVSFSYQPISAEIEVPEVIFDEPGDGAEQSLGEQASYFSEAENDEADLCKDERTLQDVQQFVGTEKGPCTNKSSM